MSAEQFHFSGQHSLRRTRQCLFLAGGCINLERGHFINLRQQDLKALQKVLLPKDSRNASTKQILKFVIHSNTEFKKCSIHGFWRTESGLWSFKATFSSTSNVCEARPVLKKKGKQLRKNHVITILKVCINLKHPGMIPQRFHHQVTVTNAVRKLQLMFQKWESLELISDAIILVRG